MIPVPIPTSSKPLTKLIDVVAQGIGTVYRPVGTVRQAMADGKARVILAEADVKVSEVWERAARRLVHTEVERQKNLDSIVEKAHAALPEKVSEAPVPKDWLTHFFDAAQDVSDQDMQEIWGRILAGEVAEPGSTSRRTLEFLKTMVKKDAEMFCSLLSVCFVRAADDWRFYIVNPVTTRIIGENFPGVDIERHLLDIGILNTELHEANPFLMEQWGFFVGKTKYKFVPPASKLHFANDFAVTGIATFNARLLSVTGQELSLVAGQDSSTQFVDELSKILMKMASIQIEKEGN